MSQTFGDYELAAKTKEVLSTLVRKEVEKLRPAPRYATVATLTPLTVTYSGDPTPMPVRTGSVVPSAVGQIVRIEGPVGDRYIADVVGAEDGVPPYNPGGGSGSNEFPDGVIIGTDGSGTEVVVTYNPPDDVLNLAVTQGLEFENIYFIIDWDLVANATGYEVEVAEKLGANTYDLTRVVQVATNTARVDGLQPYTEYGVRVTPISNIGVRGNTTAWLDVTTTGDNTIPPQVTSPTLTRGATSLIVSFPALDSLAAPDVANGNGLYEIQIDTANTFDTVNLRSALGTSTVVAFSDLTFEATWYARVRGIDTSGNIGAWSVVASLVAGAITSGQILDGAVVTSKIGDLAITTTKISDNAIESPKIAANAVVATKISAGAIETDKLAANAVTTAKLAASSVTATEIAAGVIASDKIVTGGLDAAVIKFGTMSGARITADTLDVNALTSSSLTAKTITLGAGGQIKIGNPTTDGIYINDQGIRAYKAGATSFQIDASGNATFAGTLSGATGTFAGSLSAATGTFAGSLSAATGSFAGSLSAGVSITSPTITGGLFRSASTGQRIEIGASTTYQNHAISFITTNGYYSYTGHSDTSFEIWKWGNGWNSSFSLRQGGLYVSGNVYENWSGGTSGTALANINHTHFQYASTSHTHSTYSLTSHTHSSVPYATQSGEVYGTQWIMNGQVNWTWFGTAKAWLTTGGAFTAASKNFDIPHPLNSDFRLRYASVEGPALDVIHRGRIELEDGEATVDVDEAVGLFPGTWDALTHSDSHQVMLYNETGDSNPKYTWDNGKIHITCDDDSATIAWVLIGTRKDLEPGSDTIDLDGRLIAQYPKPAFI